MFAYESNTPRACFAPADNALDAKVCPISAAAPESTNLHAEVEQAEEDQSKGA